MKEFEQKIKAMEKKVREKNIENKILEAAITSKDEELDEIEMWYCKRKQE